MEQTDSLREKVNQFLIILLPILVTQVCMCAMTFFDTMMSGRVSPNDLVGVAIGSSIWMPVFTGLNGILFAIVPIVAHFLGAQKKEKVPFAVIQAVYLAIAISIVVIICGFYVIHPILNKMELNALSYQIAHDFLAAISFGIIPLFISTVLRCFIDTLGYTRVTMLISMVALPINVLLNYVLVFGNFGFPQMGGVGAGWASAITYWFIAIISVCVIQSREPFKSHQIFSSWYRFSLAAWKEQLKIGIPIGIAIFCETSIFAVITLLMSEFSEVTIAAYQVAINVAALIYMMPLSISMALTIVVGFEAGAKRYQDAKQYGYLGIGIALLMAVMAAIVLYFGNEQISSLYTPDMDIRHLAEQFLLYAIFFQLSDAIATPVQGCLRGYKDVRVTFILAMISYWVLGLPLGYVLSHHSGLGAFGYWIGLIVGLAFGATCLSARLMRVQRKYGDIQNV
ncbi:MATE family efflux transporter [Pelosinus fermentans]|uniref:Probable multidrug resistance protein NorM n=1 Tax=Pelosinus fermentans JBW45 TaxID=1192197 RepID=I9DHN0_9FIRM|nr:MATE family efflux transporter [Pelosinus fermentans]AJQ28801.1 MATE efflux family protein [Pelosinus fermentans JBW45]